MCGITGALGTSSSGPPLAESVARMVASLEHRGPDDAGLWRDPVEPACLGTRRLAVQDPSAAGHQPMASPSGRHVVVLNGEIYNHRSLKARLAGQGRAPTWRGTSDTEVLVACIDAWGIDAALREAVGMFAIAVWDRSERRLTLARDRLGEKPLYFGRFAGAWLFGSETKAIAAHPSFSRTVDDDALASYLSLGYVPAPASIFVGVRKVMPGTIVVLEPGSDRVHERSYWSASDHVPPQVPRGSVAPHDERAAVDELESLLTRTVSEQMIADRPLGALLSGGIDSSSIVALMCAQRSSTIRTFSIGFRQSSFNEAQFAARVAAHFATDHTELYVDADDVRDTIPLLPQIYDEPFADISQIPTFLVSRLASRSVTVALTGDGGDELFGGYPRYALGARLWPAMRRVPRALRPALGGLIGSTPGAVDHAFRWAFPHDEVSGTRGLRPAQKLGKLGRAFRSRDLESLYWQLLAPWAEPTLQRRRPPGSPFPRDREPTQADRVEEDFMRRDLGGYLPDDILTKIDRASMAVGLESRAPLLDHRIVEFALRLPYELKFREGVSKWVLRQVLYRHVPRELVDRPKMGFGIPIASWLRGPLRSWADDLVASSDSDMAHLLDLRAVRRLLDRHASGVGDWHQPLWTALMFLNWANHADRSAPPQHDSGSMVVRRDAATVAHLPPECTTVLASTKHNRTL